MPDHKQARPKLPPPAFLELITELTIGQRATDTLTGLSLFLHRNIFPKLGLCSVEIYYPDSTSNRLTPPTLPQNHHGDSRHTPDEIPADDPFITNLLITGQPVELHSGQPAPRFLVATGNTSHLLAPLLDGSALSGLLYVGCRAHHPFTGNYLTGIHTLTAVIGSRLKSMETIRKLRDSMHALEYSEQLRAALYDISEQTHSAAKMEDLYISLHQTVGRLIHARNFIIALVEERADGQFIKFPYFADLHDSRFQGKEVKLNQKKKSLTSYLLESRQPLLLTPGNFDRVCADNDIAFIGSRPHSWLGAPFYLKHLSGAVIVQSYQEVIYTEKDVGLMTYVARHVGDALSRKRTMDELKKAKELAEEAEKNKSSFLANMSHEIRTPMNGIIGMTELVLSSDISAQQRSFLNMVRTSANRLLKLINDILDFSKIEAGKFELETAPFNLRHSVTNSLQILTISAADKNVDFDIQYDSSIPEIIYGDADRLCQILINLVGNAIKFTSHGSVTVTISPEVNSNSQTKQLQLHFQITDSGIGIPADKIANVFQAFNQIGTTRDSSNRGTGLGLVIAAELVEMMGGKIWVESQPGIGSTFHFTASFLCNRPETDQRPLEQEAANGPLPARIRHQPRKILLVEDEFINRTLVKTVLEREGWQVQSAENGLEALDAIHNTTFDLVLMDIQMPELNGYETTRIIRREEANNGRHLPIIAMTAYAVKGDQEKCFEAGMDGYISKPIRPDLLRTEIETILNTPLPDAPGRK